MKNVFKKLLCVLMALTVFSGFPIYAEDQQQAIGTEVLEAMEILRELEIIGDYYDYNMNPDETVTRADFAVAAAKSLGAKVSDRQNTTYYYDVPPSHYACAEINALTDMGLVTGYDKTSFHPDDTMETAAACRILLTALGYEKTAERDGGYPYGYLKHARELKLLDASQTSSELTRGVMLTMLYEALKAPMMTPEVTSSEGRIEYQKDEDKTILAVSHKAYYHKGIVDGVNKSSFNGTVFSKENEVEIDGTVYESTVDLSDFLGEEIEYIERKLKEDDDGEVIWAKRTGKTEVIRIAADDFESFDAESYRLSYDNGSSRSKSIQLKRGLQLIYNGGLITNHVSDRINDRCELKVIADKDGYSRVVARKKKNIVVKSADTTNEIFNDFLNLSHPFELHSEDRQYFRIQKGGSGDVSVSDIKADDVLTVYESYYEAPETYGSHIEVIITSNKVTGAIERSEEIDDHRYVTVGGVSYKDLTGKKFTTGENATLYIDADGEIAYAKTSPSTSFAAYLIKGNLSDEEDQYEYILRIKMLKEDGNVETLICAQKLKLDGETYRKPEVVFDELTSTTETGKKFVPQLALIKVNQENEVISIDRADPYEGDGTLRKSIPRGGMTYKGTGYIGSDATNVGAIDSNTVVFKIPTKTMLDAGIETDDDYVIGTSGIKDNDWITATAYRTTEKKAAAEKYLVVEHSGSASSEPWPILVQKITYTLDADEQALATVIGYNGYNQVSIQIPDGAEWKKKGAAWQNGKPEDLKPGMVLLLPTNARGQATMLDLIYDPNNRANYYKTAGFNDLTNEVGIVEDTGDGILSLKIGERSIMVKDGSADVLIYDLNGGKNPIHKGSVTEAKCYDDSYDQSNPDTYSDAVVFQYQRWARRIYIFK